MINIDYLKGIVNSLADLNNTAIGLSLADVHHPGLFSLVVSGEPGTLLRIFIADKKIKPFAIQLHTHRYDIQLTSLSGQIRHHVAIPVTHFSDSSFEHSTLPMYMYKSKLNGGDGLSYMRHRSVVLKDYLLPEGASLRMNTSEFHTVSCSKDSIWIVEEKGFTAPHSVVLGVPFATENFYNKPSNFEITSNRDYIIEKLKETIKRYESAKY